MAPPTADPTTSISHSDPQRMFVRGADLVEELIGHLSFTEMFYFELTGRRPTRGQTALLDAVMVTLMEHGLNPSAIATRLIYHSAPRIGISNGLWKPVGGPTGAWVTE